MRKMIIDLTQKVEGEGMGTNKILVCAPSNAAVDELLKKVAHDGVWSDNGTLYTPKIVRCGPGVRAELKQYSLEFLAKERSLSSGAGGVFAGGGTSLAGAMGLGGAKPEPQIQNIDTWINQQIAKGEAITAAQQATNAELVTTVSCCRVLNACAAKADVEPVSIAMLSPSCTILAISCAIATFASRLRFILAKKGGSDVFRFDTNAPCTLRNSPRSTKGRDIRRMVWSVTPRIRDSSMTVTIPRISTVCSSWDSCFDIVNLLGR